MGVVFAPDDPGLRNSSRSTTSALRSKKSCGLRYPAPSGGKSVTVRRGLVFAGGYVVGVAWELGVLRGLQDVNADLLAKVIAADVVVGTSAGSTVAAQITSGTALDSLYAAQLSEASAEIEVDVDLREVMARFAKVAETTASATDIRRRIGALALATQTTVDEPTYRASRAPGCPFRHGRPETSVWWPSTLNRVNRTCSHATQGSRWSMLLLLAPPFRVSGHR
jgi:hypothetical protein